MPAAPNAWIPFSRVRNDLLAIYRSLRLVRGDTGRGGVSQLPDGRQMLTPPSIEDSDESYRLFPARITEGLLLIPPVVVDFFDSVFVDHSWLDLPSDPAADQFLRLAIPATATTANAMDPLFPVDVTLGVGTWSFTDYADGTPSFEPGIATGNEREYYWYPIRVTGGVITARYLPVYFYGTPPIIFA